MTSIITITKPINTLKEKEVTIPGSKYLANRLLIIAALAEGTSIFYNLPQNSDMKVASQGITNLGAKISKNGNTWEIIGTGGKIKSPASVFTGENGTFSRFVAALAGLGNKPIILDSAPRMKERPMGQILNALRDLGAKVKGETFPITITGPLIQGETSLKGNESSQFLSALALTLPYAQVNNNVGKETQVRILTSLVSKKYLTMTLDLMKKFGITAYLESVVKKNNQATLIIPQGRYQGRKYTVEADPVSATYFMALAALSKESLTICDYPDHTLQGEGDFPIVLEKMGCGIERVDKGLKIYPPAKGLRGITVDMTHMPDAAPTLAVIAACASGKTRINGISHLRFKESNRVEDIANELQKVGIKVKTGSQFMEIEGGNPCPALLDSHNDHRLVMSLSLLALRSREIKIKNYLAIEKSFPGYFNKLIRLGFIVSYL